MLLHNITIYTRALGYLTHPDMLRGGNYWHMIEIDLLYMPIITKSMLLSLLSGIWEKIHTVIIEKAFSIRLNIDNSQHISACRQTNHIIECYFSIRIWSSDYCTKSDWVVGIQSVIWHKFIKLFPWN